MMLDETAGDTEHAHDEFFKKNCFKPEYRLSHNLKEILYVYSQLQLPFTQREADQSAAGNQRSPEHFSRNAFL